MQIREYSLPAGWFPRDPSGVSREIQAFLTKSRKIRSKSKAVISPHAGWYYCGRIAAAGISALDPDAQTIAVIGGHLGASSPPLFAMEDAARTPFGALPIDTQLRSLLLEELGGKEDIYRDNTVEVLLPMVHFLFPKASLLWLRLGESKDSYEAGKLLSSAAASLKRKVNLIASTDLTHYGPNYGFSPKGMGVHALNWVKNVNDSNFIKAVESADKDEVLRRAVKDRSACSAGAVLAAMGFAEEEKSGGAQLLEYATSADIDLAGSAHVPDSFVGYAALVFG